LEAMQETGINRAPNPERRAEETVELVLTLAEMRRIQNQLGAAPIINTDYPEQPPALPGTLRDQVAGVREALEVAAQMLGVALLTVNLIRWE